MKSHQAYRLAGYLLLTFVAILLASISAKNGSYSPLPTSIEELLLPIPILLIAAIPLGVGFYGVLKIKSKSLRIVASVVIGVIDAALFYLIFILIRILFIRLG